MYVCIVSKYMPSEFLHRLTLDVWETFNGSLKYRWNIEIWLFNEPFSLYAWMAWLPQPTLMTESGRLNWLHNYDARSLIIGSLLQPCLSVLIDNSHMRCTRPSVRPSATRRYCIKTRKASVMISSSSGSPTILLVFWCQISSQNSKRVTPSDGVKPGWGRQNKNFSRFERQYLENGASYVQSYY